MEYKRYDVVFLLCIMTQGRGTNADYMYRSTSHFVLTVPRAHCDSHFGVGGGGGGQ